jgi:hypothetical protein
MVAFFFNLTQYSFLDNDVQRAADIGGESPVYVPLTPSPSPSMTSFRASSHSRKGDSTPSILPSPSQQKLTILSSMNFDVLQFFLRFLNYFFKKFFRQCWFLPFLLSLLSRCSSILLLSPSTLRFLAPII